MRELPKDTGLAALVKLPLGTHICHFYRNEQELLDAVIPYLRAGLLNNERCIWICAEPFNANAAARLVENSPDFNRFLKTKQIEILDYHEWYSITGQNIEVSSTLGRCRMEMSATLRAGYKGLRLTGNLPWARHLQSVIEYEECFCSIGAYVPLIAMCSYPLSGLEASDLADLIEIAHVHQFALIRRNSAWELVKAGMYHNTVWQSLLDSLSESMLAIDDSGTILTASHMCLEFFGCTTLADLGPNIDDFARRFRVRSITGKLPPEAILTLDNDILVEDYWKAVSSVRGNVEFLVSLRKSKSNPVIPGLFLMVFHDLTDLRKLESVKNEFLQVMSHELRNPVQTIRVLLNLIGSSINNDDASLMKYIRLADTCVNQITTLIEDLLAIRQIGNDNRIDAVPTDFRTLLQDTLEPYLAGSKHNIICLFDDRLSIPVMIDPVRVRQILTNILDNAIKYTPPGKRIWIDFTLSGNCTVVTVEDEGIGIPQGEIDRIFDQFYRASNVHGYTGGIGLGLYVSRYLARMHGGDLWVKMRDKGGTIMSLCLPVLLNDAS